MLSVLKKSLYFVVASYFAFWSKFVLRRWRPRIIVLTGSSGKTTLLHMVEAQIGNEAIYTHHANSSIGIPFHILGMESNVESPHQWLIKFVLAPFKIWRKLPSKKLYVVEADCDRPGEGKFIGRLLKPEVTLWVSSHKTHSMNFDKQVRQKKFS
ncbi:MAG TPA: hypothetical protein VFB03_02700, partial [Candidatus Saccharimonadales bacterium]|nr:hypothetical protein [Candidatus Saccharimonadales bacterium]